MSDPGFQVEIINDEKGKGMVALKSYKEGEIIFEEKPVLCCQFAWNGDYDYAACDNCMAPLETAQENVRRLTDRKTIVLPFPECCGTKKELITECSACGTKYCSAECFKEAYQKYHRTLCLLSRDPSEKHPMIELKELWKKMHYPPETATIMFFARMVAFVSQAEDKPAALATFNKFCHRTFNYDHEIAHNLLAEKFTCHIDELRDALERAVNIDYVEHWFTPDGFRSLLALVGTNGQGVGTSAFSRWVKNVSALELAPEKRIEIDKYIEKLYDEMDDVVGQFLNNEGSGLYILQSSINHSCVPNAIVEFPYSNSTLVVKALKDIAPGEEICIGYLDECDLDRSRVSRQKELKALYLFVCHCDKCIEQADDDHVTSSEDEMSFQSGTTDEDSDGFP